MAVTGAPELLIVMGAAATQEQVDDVVARLEEAGCAALVTPGREATVIECRSTMQKNASPASCVSTYWRKPPL